MKRYLLVLLSFIFFTSCKQKKENNDLVKSLPQSNSIVIGEVDSLYSNELQEERKIWIHIPESFSNKENKNKKYPVLYLLDGPSHFYSLSGMVRQLSSVNANTVLPEMIIIGISNTNRSRDLTPTHVDIDFFTNDSIQYESGGGTKFLDFIDKELIPYVEENYPASNHRTLIGHSFGGLSVINALINKKDLFKNYLAIDPSLWWDNMAFKNVAESIITKNNYNKKSLYLAISNTMAPEMNLEGVRNDTIKKTAHIRSELELAKSLQNDSTNELNFKWKYYDDDTHGSVPLIAEYDGLRYFFKWHNFKFNNIVFNANKLTKKELLEIPKSHFKNVSRHLGYEVIPPKDLINIIGYTLMEENMPDKASAFFDLNIENYPERANVYASRGDCYIAQNDTLKAIQLYEKAYQLDSNKFYKNRIRNLRKGKNE